MTETLRLQARCGGLLGVLLALEMRLAAARSTLKGLPSPEQVPPEYGASFPPAFLQGDLEVIMLQGICLLVALLAALDLVRAALPHARRPGAVAVNLCHLLICCAMLMQVEFAMRTFCDPWLETTEARPDADVYWSYNPRFRARGHIANRYGLRGMDIVSEKRPDELRVLVLGDSISAGLNLREEQTYPFQLRAWLQRRCPSRLVRVQNGAVYGYAPFQALHVFETMRDVFKPDIVIMENGGNRAGLARQAAAPSRGPWVREARRQLFSSVLYLYLRQRLAGTVGELGPPPAVTERDPLEEQRDDDDYRRNLERICELGQRAGVKVVFYLPLRLRSPASRDMDTMRAVATRHQVPCLDLIALWQRRGNASSLMLPGDDCHPNADGARVQAEDVGTFLIESGMIPANDVASANRAPDTRASLNRPGTSAR